MLIQISKSISRKDLLDKQYLMSEKIKEVENIVPQNSDFDSIKSCVEILSKVYDEIMHELL
jgi:hypothetical protein